MRFPQGKDPCGIPQGHRCFALWGFLPQALFAISGTHVVFCILSLWEIPHKPKQNEGFESRQRDTRYARQPAQYVNTSIRSTLVCQYVLPSRVPYGPDLTQASMSLSLAAHCDQEQWF